MPQLEKSQNATVVWHCHSASHLFRGLQGKHLSFGMHPSCLNMNRPKMPLCRVAFPFCIPIVPEGLHREIRLIVRCDQGTAAGRHPGGRRDRAAGGDHCGGGHQPAHVPQRSCAPLHGHHLQVCSGQVAFHTCHGAQGERSLPCGRGLSLDPQEALELSSCCCPIPSC